MRALRLFRKLLRRLHFEYRVALWSCLSRFRRTVTCSTRQGRLTVRLGAGEVIGQELFCRGDYELAFVDNVLALLERLGLRPAKGAGTVLDVGANIGVISIGMLHRGEFSQAVAIEPEPINFGLLQQNAIRNGFESRMVCLRCAASDRTADLRLELSDGNYGDHRVRASGAEAPPARFGEMGRAEIPVAARTLDDVVAELPSTHRGIALLWIDVQGHEAQALAGARRLLSTGIPVVAEIWPYGLARAGTSPAAFAQLAATHWKRYWVWRRNRFVEYPIDTLGLLFNELGAEGEYENVVFTA